MRRLLLAAVVLMATLTAPAVAHDRGSIVFMRPSPATNPDGYDLWTVQPDGRGLRLLDAAPPGTQDYNPDWSPDGRRVLFERRLPLDGDFYVVNGDGSGLRRVAHCEDPECWGFGEGEWSRDGRRIVAGVAVGPKSNDFPLKVFIAIVSPDGRGFRQISTPEAGEEDHYPTWSPDGRTIVFERLYANDPITPTALIAVDVKTGVERTIYRFPSWAPGGGVPKYSPDGRRILFNYWCAISPGPECPPESRVPRNETIATIRPDGTGLRVLPLRELGDSASWSPDGKRLVFRCQLQPFTWYVCTSRLDGSHVHRFPWQVASAHPDWGRRP
jgi:Tol biopolymer transport system component